MGLLGNSSNRNSSETMATITRWCAFFSGVLTIILGFISIFNKSARLEVPNDFMNDHVNQVLWRLPLFSFTPDTFIDVWTPMVMGLITMLIHFPSFNLPLITENFGRLFIWLLILALFGNLGYSGGLGIIFGTFTLFADLLALITCLFFHDGPASLELTFGSSFYLKNKGDKMHGGNVQM